MLNFISIHFNPTLIIPETDTWLLFDFSFLTQTHPSVLVKVSDGWFL